jgi:hypothetical protein
MRCVTAIKQGKGRSSLGSALDRLLFKLCLTSAEGRQLQKKFRNAPDRKRILILFFGMVRSKDDPKHPKLLLSSPPSNRGEMAKRRSLLGSILAQRLREIIAHQIRAELLQRRKNVGGGESFTCIARTHDAA